MTHNFIQSLHYEAWFVTVLNCNMWYAELLKFQCVIWGVMCWLKKTTCDTHVYAMVKLDVALYILITFWLVRCRCLLKNKTWCIHLFYDPYTNWCMIHIPLQLLQLYLTDKLDLLVLCVLSHRLTTVVVFCMQQECGPCPVTRWPQ